MPASPNKVAYIDRYNREHMKQIKFYVSIDNEADILAMLDSVESKAGYIKDLIRADIAARKVSNTIELNNT